MNLTLKCIASFLLLSMSCPQGFAQQKSAAAPQMDKTYPVTGTLYPILVTTISSQVSGRVNQVLADVGDRVAQDQVLVLIDPVFLEIEYKKQQAALDLAKIAYQQAKREFIRMRNLWEKREKDRSSISRKQFDDAKFLWEQKKILLDQVLIDLEKIKIQLDETSIKAPYAGVITKRFIDPGEAVTVIPLVPILEIMDLSQLILEFSLPQDMLSLVHPGFLVHAEIEGQQKSFDGRIQKILPAVDASNRSFKCRVIVDNEHLNLQPGLSLTAKIQIK